MVRSLALAASFALATSAFLIPSTNLENDKDAEAKAMALAGLMPVTSHLVKLECASCVLEDSEQEDGSGDNALLLNFMTSGNALLLNDIQIFPTTINSNPLRVPLVDAEMGPFRWDSSMLSKSNNKSRAVSSYGIQSSSSGSDPSGHQTTTITINLFALDQSPISVDEVHVNIVDNSAAHTLHLQSVSTSPSPNSPSDPNPGNPTTGDAAYKDCAGLPPLLCKWRSIISHKISGLKHGSGFRKGCNGKPIPTGTSAGMTELKGADNEDTSDVTHLPTHIKGIPPKNRFGSHLHPHERPHKHHRHHGIHMFLRAFLRAFVGVLIPVLVGVIAGMAASIIGMAIGQLVALLYMRVRGERAALPDYILVEQADRSSIDSEPLPLYAEAEEKGEAPPEYRDVPAVEEGKKDDE